MEADKCVESYHHPLGCILGKFQHISPLLIFLLRENHNIMCMPRCIIHILDIVLRFMLNTLESPKIT